MAKKKNKPIEPEVMEEAIEEVIEEAVEEPVEIAEPIAQKADRDDFIARTLKAINSMENPYKAERLANRLLRKRKG